MNDVWCACGTPHHTKPKLNLPLPGVVQGNVGTCGGNHVSLYPHNKLIGVRGQEPISLEAYRERVKWRE